MPSTDLILDFTAYDVSQVVADLHEIRRFNPQRFELEQLSAIILDDPVRNICVGYKDHQVDDFWTRGHMPGKPLLPGILMCEAAAQCCTYFTQKHDLLGCSVVGFGGLDEVRFRASVFPGDRMVIVVQLLKARRNSMAVFRFQEFVGQRIVCEGMIKGVPLRD